MRLTRANFDLQIPVLTTQVSQVRFQQTFRVLESEEILYHFPRASPAIVPIFDPYFIE